MMEGLRRGSFVGPDPYGVETRAPTELHRLGSQTENCSGARVYFRRNSFGGGEDRLSIQWPCTLQSHSIVPSV